jgi:hypothetical protein
MTRRHVGRRSRNALRDLVRVPVSRSGLDRLADGLNHLHEYPARAWKRKRLWQSLFHTAGAGPRPSAVPPTEWDRERWEELETFFETLVRDLWSARSIQGKRLVILPNAEPGTPDRAAVYIQEIVRTFFGTGLSERLKRCEVCHRWFADTTRNRSKLRCGIGACTASRVWTRPRRRAAGHAQYRLAPAKRQTPGKILARAVATNTSQHGAR